MEWNWSTFLLEIINFLVLLWILKRFLYRPVLGVIARRRAAIEEQLVEAHGVREQAERLQSEYENRLADWDQERDAARSALAQELDAERARRLAALQAALDQERDRSRATEVRRRADELRDIEQRALAQAARFATRLLRLAAGAELEARLVDIAVADLGALAADQVSALRTQWGPAADAIRVSSAFPLPEDRRRRLEQALQQVSGRATAVEYRQDPQLLAGLRIDVGAWMLHASLQDELQGLAGFARRAG